MIFGIFIFDTYINKSEDSRSPFPILLAACESFIFLTHLLCLKDEFDKRYFYGSIYLTCVQ